MAGKNKKRGLKNNKKGSKSVGGQSSRTEKGGPSSASGGQSQSTTVPSGLSLDEVKILVVGHKGAGKSTAIKKILELGSQSRHRTQTIPYFETTTKRYTIFEQPSNFEYVPLLATYGSSCGIAVLIISGSDDVLDDMERMNQTIRCVCFIRALQIPKILIVVNKMDDPTYSHERFAYQSLNLQKVFMDAGYEWETDVINIPMSAKIGLNIRTDVSDEKWKWWEARRCLFDQFDQLGATVSAEKIIGDATWSLKLKESSYLKRLLIVDSNLDANQNDATLWFQRVEAAGNIQLLTAFEAAEKALERGFIIDPSLTTEVHDVSRPFVQKMQGDLHRSKKEFDLASIYYNVACVEFKEQGWEKAADKVQDLKCLTQIESLDLQEQKEKDQAEKKNTRRERKQKKEREKKEEIEEERRVNKEREEIEEENQVTVSVPESINPSLTTNKKMEQNKDRDKIEREEEHHVILESINPSLTFNKKNEISIVTYFVLDEEPQEVGIYCGFKHLRSANITIPISILRCNDYQLQNHETLLSLGDNAAHVLSTSDVSDFTFKEKLSACYVVQPIKTVEYYFNLKLETFCSRSKNVEDDEQIILGKWWQFMQFGFKKIFGDILDGLIFLSFGEHNCDSSLYVINDVDGKVLPSMHPEAQDIAFVEDVLKRMKTIVNLPFCGRKYSLTWLPTDLKHFFKFVSREKLKHAPVWWLLNHHYFWSGQQCVDFTINLRSSMNDNNMSYFRLELEEELKKNGMQDWKERIPVGSVLEKIWIRGEPRDLPTSDDTKAAKKAGWVKVAQYKTPADIVRFMASVYRHYNDKEYKNYRSKKLTSVEIEQILRGCFPNIYQIILDALYWFWRSTQSGVSRQQAMVIFPALYQDHQWR